MKTLKNHQLVALTCMDASSHLGLFYSPGTGKTAIALTWIRDALKDRRIGSALVVCPATLVPQWYMSLRDMVEFEEWSEEDVELVRRHLLVTSYQKVYKSERKEVHHRNGKVSVRKSISLRDAVDRTWGVVIIDESHGLGSHSSIQTKSCIVLSRLAKHRFIMTGTPHSGSAKGSGRDYGKLYGQIQFLTRGTEWGSWTEFCNRYVASFDPWGKPRKYKEDACKDLMRKYAIVARLEDCVDMPECTETEVICPLEEQKVYKDIKEGFIIPYDVEISAAGGEYIKLLQICSGHLKTESGVKALGTSKDAALESILDGTDDKVVIFCNFRASIDRCEKICLKKGLKTLVYDGRSKGPTWEQFQKGMADVLICQYQSGGPGLNLQISSTMVFYEPTMSSLLLEQAKCRIWRTGQRNHCRYLFLVTPDTVEEKTSSSVRRGVDVTADDLRRWAKGIQ